MYILLSILFQMAVIAIKATEKRKPPFLPAEVFEKLKCEECKDYLSTAPILKHREYGSICGNCVKYFDTDNFIRNTEYETLAAYIDFPCKNNGCRKRIPFGKSSEHDLSCLFKLYDCPVNQSCTWTGQYQEIGMHFFETHKNCLVNGQFHPNFTNQCEEIKLYVKDSNIFLVQTKCVISQCKFWCLIRHFGPTNKTILFKYKLEFNGNKKCKSFYSEEKTVLSDVCYIMDKTAAVEINVSALLKFLNCPTIVNCTIHIFSSDCEQKL